MELKTKGVVNSTQALVKDFNGQQCSLYIPVVANGAQPPVQGAERKDCHLYNLAVGGLFLRQDEVA